MTVRIKIKRESNHSDIKQWCYDNFGPDWWDDDDGAWSWVGMYDMIEFEFFDEEDATLFMLRWS